MSSFSQQDQDKGIPKVLDVAIIGGGIIGVSAAWALARAGVRVGVFEKGRIGAEQSSRNWGWVRTLGRDPAEVPLAVRAKTLWTEIQAQTDVGFRNTGMLYLQESEHDAEQHQRWLDSARTHGLDVTVLGKDAALRHLPQTGRLWMGAMFSATDGVAEPRMAPEGIAGLARAAGARIVEQCAVRGLERSAGRVSGVITEHGAVSAQAVLLAGGAWSRLFCGNAGIEFPQLKVRGSVLRTTPLQAGPQAAINGRDFTCRRRLDGGYTVAQFGASMADLVPDSFRLMRRFFQGWLRNKDFVRLRVGKRFFEELAIPRRFGLDSPSPFERCRVLDPLPSRAGLQQAWQRLTHAFPGFSSARIAESWAGYIDVTPDALPVMSAVDALPGFYLASGFSGHGFGIGPAAGEAMKDLILGLQPRVDLRAFNLGRFT